MDEKKIMNTINELIDKAHKAVDNNNIEEVIRYLQMINKTTETMPLSSSTKEEIIKKAKEIEEEIIASPKKQVKEEASIFKNIKFDSLNTKEKQEFDVNVYTLTHPRL